MCKHKKQQNSGREDEERMPSDLRWPTALASDQIRTLSYELDVPYMVASWLHQAGYRCVDDLYYVAYSHLRDTLQAVEQTVSPDMLRHIVSRVDLIEQSVHQDRGIEGMLSPGMQSQGLGDMQPPYEFPPVFSEAINDSSLHVELGDSVIYHTLTDGVGTSFSNREEMLGLTEDNMAAFNNVCPPRKDRYKKNEGSADGSRSDSGASAEGIYGGSLLSRIDLFGDRSMRSAKSGGEALLAEGGEMGMRVNTGAKPKSQALFTEEGKQDNEDASERGRHIGLFTVPVSPIAGMGSGLTEVDRNDDTPPWSP
jgi:hypothetical protein